MTEPSFVDSAADRHNRAQENARNRLLEELEKTALRIADVEAQIQQREEDTLHLEELNRTNLEDEHMDQVATRNEQGDRQPRNIAPEDALDTIIRLENAVKLAQRRNVLFEKEVGTQQRMLKEKTKELDAIRKEHDNLVSVTGFTPDTKTEDVDKLRADIEEMERLETTLIEESKTAKVIIRKKQQLVETLQREVESKKQTEENLYSLYNDIRVKDRDVQQAELNMEDLKRQDRKRNTALTIAEDKRDSVALNCLEKDKDYLKRELARCREHARAQESIQKKQVQRQLQLQARLDMIGAAMKELQWEKEFEAISHSNNNGLVSDAVGEPDDVDRIFPPDETIAAEVYQLLRTNFDTASNALARKDILLIEKQAVVEAMEDKVEAATRKHNTEARQQMIADRQRGDEMGMRQDELTEKLAEYRSQIDDLTRKNLKLRGQIERMTSE